MELKPTPTGEIEKLSIFPLSSAVLFPGIVIPLHIDEPRYSQMVSDVMAKDQVLAIAMLEPGRFADLVLLDEGLEPARVWIEGRLVFEKPEVP